ncbi:hypothetical protein CUMW_276450, partial [Citrus unshiu]
MLMNLKTLDWDKPTLETLGIPAEIRPRIVSNSEIIGKIGKGWPITGIPISGCLGDQHAAMLGQACKKGEAKSTYGTGAFILLNTGEVPLSLVQKHRQTMLCRVQLLSLELQFSGSETIEELASQVNSTGGVYFVPAFNGLFAPWWRDDARGVCIGITRFTSKAHIARAVLESMCFQVKDVLDSMQKDAVEKGAPLPYPAFDIAGWAANQKAKTMFNSNVSNRGGLVGKPQSSRPADHREQQLSGSCLCRWIRQVGVFKEEADFLLLRMAKTSTPLSS